MRSLPGRPRENARAHACVCVRVHVPVCGLKETLFRTLGKDGKRQTLQGRLSRCKHRCSGV